MDTILYAIGCLAIFVSMAYLILLSPQPGGGWPDVPRLPSIRYWFSRSHWFAYGQTWRRYLESAYVITMSHGKLDVLRAGGMLLALTFSCACAFRALLTGYTPAWDVVLLVDTIGFLLSVHSRRAWVAGATEERARTAHAK